MVAVIVTAGAGTGVYLGTQADQPQAAQVADYVVSDPSSGPITNQTIYVENSTIIAGEGVTINTGGFPANSTETPQPTSTPIPVTVTYREISKDNQTICLEINISPSTMMLPAENLVLHTLQERELWHWPQQKGNSISGTTTLTYDISGFDFTITDYELQFTGTFGNIGQVTCIKV